MKALVVAPGGKFRLALGDVAEPQPAPGEALVNVRATSLNRGEVRRALASRAPGTVVGWDVAGVVAEPAADGSGPPEGARVVGLVPTGSWAERVAVATDRLGVLPDACSFAAAATLPVAGLTALRALRKAPLLGSRVLVTGAAGGVGGFAVQLAARAGAEVTAVAASVERARPLVDLGARHVLTDLAPGEPAFDLVLESVGGTSLAAALQRVRSGGTVVTFGNSARAPTTFDASSFYAKNGATMIGFLIFRDLDLPPQGAVDLGYLAELVARDELDPRIEIEADWDDAGAVNDAVAALMERRLAGKAVIHVG